MRNIVLLGCAVFALGRLFFMPDFDALGSIGVDYGSSMLGSNEDYALAKRQSLGFFDDIPSASWKLMQQKVNSMSPNIVLWLLPQGRNNRYQWFWQGHYEPDFTCPHERRIGRQADGGKWICDPHRIAKKVEDGGSCLVYSVGSNNDFSFEQDVHAQIHKECDIHTFDFSDYSEGAKAAGGKITYHQQGLGLDQNTNRGKFKSLSTTVQELGHQNRVIDIFKIDCEGCEYETAASWFEAEKKHGMTIRQIQVELHGNPPDKQKTMAFFDLMYENGYVIFHKEFNLISIYGDNSHLAIEYAFLKLDTEFVNAIPRKKGVDALNEASF